MSLLPLNSIEEPVPLELWVALYSPMSMEVYSTSDSMYIVSTTKLLCLCTYGFVKQCNDW